MLSRWREKAGLWEPLPHEHGAQSAEQSEVLQYMEAGGTEPLPHEHGARSAGMRMWEGLREHEGGDIYENVSHQR